MTKHDLPSLTPRFPRLRSAKLGHNQFTGIVPSVWSECFLLSELELQSCGVSISDLTVAKEHFEVHLESCSARIR